MAKIYRVLDWLELNQAIDYLHTLTGAEPTRVTMLQLCTQGNLPVYADLTGTSGVDFERCEKAKASGFHLVITPIAAFIPCELIETVGMTTIGHTSSWHPDSPDACRNAVFRRTDIEALAAKMNEEVKIEPEKPLTQSERRSVGKIISTLAAMTKLDLSKPYAAAEVLSTAAATNGSDIPSTETIVKFLKLANESTGKE